jgi:hypothetical protein
MTRAGPREMHMPSIFKSKKKMPRGIFIPQTLGGLGDRPQAEETGAFEVRVNSDPRMRGPFSPEQLGVPRAVDAIQAKKVVATAQPPMPANIISVLNRYVGSTKALRIDSGILNRTDILICNMSDTTVWINTYPQFISGQGHPLAGNTSPPICGVGAYNGGTLAIEAGPKVEFYAITTAGVDNLVVVWEMAR